MVSLPASIYPTVGDNGRVTIEKIVREELDIEKGDVLHLEIKEVDKR